MADSRASAASYGAAQSWSGASSSITGSMYGPGGRRVSTIERIAATSKRGLFSILFVMVKSHSVGQMWVVLELLIDLFQLLAFPFNSYQQNFPWNSSQSEWFQKFVRPFAFDTFFEESAAVFYIVVAILVLLLADALFVGYTFSRNKYKMLWVVNLLRNCSGLASTILYIPFTGILAARLKCHGDGVCWTGIDLFEKVLAIVVGIMFICLSLLCGICFSDANPASRAVLGRSHSRIDLCASAILAFLTIIFTLLDGNGDNSWILAGILLVSGVFTSFLFTWYLPYYRYRFSLAKVATFWLLTWSAVCLLIALASGSQDNQAFIFFAASSPLVVMAAVATADWRRRRIEASNCDDLRNALDVELKTRFYLIQAGIFFSYRPGALPSDLDYDCPVEESVAKKTVATVNAWYRTAARRNPRSSLLRLFWSNHYQYFMGNGQLALSELQAAEELSPHFDEEFFIYRRRKMVQDEIAGGKGDVIQFIKYQKHLTEAQRHDLRATHAQIAFWTELLKADPDYSALNRTARRVTTSIAKAQKSYLELLHANPNAPQTLRMYAGFNMDVVNDPGSAEALIARAAELDDFQRDDGAGKEGGNSGKQCVLEAGTMTVAEMLMDDRYATVTMSGDLHKEGLVVGTNAAACRLLGYRTRELVGRNIAAIVPEPFGAKHASYVRRYLEEGTSEWIDRPNRVFAVHKSGYAIAIVLHVKQVCSPTGGILFIGAMKPIEGMSTAEDGGHTTHSVIVSRDGTVLTCTASCGSLLGIGPEQLAPTAMRPHVTRFIPDYASMYAQAFAETSQQQQQHMQQQQKANPAGLLLKSHFDAVTIVTPRSRVIGSLDVSTMTSTGGDLAIVLNIIVRPVSSPRMESSASPRHCEDRRASLSPLSLAPPLGTHFGSSTLLGVVDEGDPTSPRHDAECTDLPPPLVVASIPTVSIKDIGNGDSASTSLRDKRLGRVRFGEASHHRASTENGEEGSIELALVSEEEDAPAVNSGDEGTINTRERFDAEDEHPFDGRDGRAPSLSGSHVSSSASARMDHVREQILYGSERATGRLALLLHLAYLLVTAGLIVIAAIGMVETMDKTQHYAKSVDAAISASTECLHTTDIATSVAKLQLVNMGVYFSENQTTLRSTLVTAATNLEATHRDLCAGVQDLPEYHKSLYMTPSIQVSVGTKTQLYNMWDLIDTVASDALLAARVSISEFTTANPSVEFLESNTAKTVFRTLETSLSYYVDAATASSAYAEDVGTRYFAIAIAFVLFSVVFIFMPLFVAIERAQTEVLWRFLVVSRRTCAQMLQRCTGRLEARRALNDGFDTADTQDLFNQLGDSEDATNAHMGDSAAAEHDHGTDHDFEAIAVGTADGAANGREKKNHVTAFGTGESVHGLRAHTRRGRARARRETHAAPPWPKRMRLMVRNQSGPIARVALLCVVAIAFYCATHALVDTFVRDNDSTAISVNYSNRRMFLMMFSMYAIREVAAPTNMNSGFFANLFEELTSEARQIHEWLLYGNATLGIQASATQPIYRSILFENGCVDSSPSDCDTYYGGLLASGMSTAYLRFLRDLANLMETAVALPSPMQLNATAAFFNSTTYNTMETFGMQYLRPSLTAMTSLFGSNLSADVSTLRDQYLTATIVFCCFAAVVYLLLLVPLPKRAREDARKMQVLLLCVPAEVLSATPPLAALIREHYNTRL